VVDPRGYRISASKGFVRHPAELAGLPGIEFDLRVEGDHIWLRFPRLPVSKPKPPEDRFKPFVTYSNDPNAAKPSIDEAAFLRWLDTAAAGKSAEERAQLQARGRAAITRFLNEYGAAWEE
jgi:hypothetical protein